DPIRTILGCRVVWYMINCRMCDHLTDLVATIDRDCLESGVHGGPAPVLRRETAMTNLGLRPARLVVQSDRRLGREALAAYFANGQGFTVVGHTDSAHGLRTLCALSRPDICLIDVESLSARTVRLLREIRTSFPSIDVV